MKYFALSSPLSKSSIEGFRWWTGTVILLSFWKFTTSLIFQFFLFSGNARDAKPDTDFQMIPSIRNFWSSSYTPLIIDKGTGNSFLAILLPGLVWILWYSDVVVEFAHTGSVSSLICNLSFKGLIFSSWSISISWLAIFITFSLKLRTTFCDSKN